VTLAEELGVEHEVLPFLIRYDDLDKFLTTGTVKGLNRDPLRTAEDRWLPEDTVVAPGKHKVVHSQYTRPDATQQFKKHLEHRAKTMTFGEMRTVIDNAIENELKRSYFHWQRLHDTKKFTNYRTTPAFKDAVTKSLEAVKDEPVIQLLAHERIRQAA
jgi:hypothetical protein